MGKEPREINAKSLKLQAASRDDDGFFSTFILRKISIRFTSVLVERNVSPNTVTLLSLLVGFIAAYVAAQGSYLAGGSLLLLSLILDCVDGEIARYKNCTLHVCLNLNPSIPNDLYLARERIRQ